MKKLALRAIISIAILAPGFSSYSQSLPIAFIEVFGNRKVSANEVIQKAGIHEGDSISMAEFDLEQIFNRIMAVPAVKLTMISPICCEDLTGGWLIFIGIAENDITNSKYHKSPVGSIMLTKEMTQNYYDFMEALQKAVMSRNSSED